MKIGEIVQTVVQHHCSFQRGHENELPLIRFFLIEKLSGKSLLNVASFPIFSNQYFFYRIFVQYSICRLFVMNEVAHL